MKRELLYTDSSRDSRRLTTLDGTTALGEKPFYLLPDRQLSFIQIVPLPAVSKKKLPSLIRFQIRKIHPASPKNMVFDYIPCRTASGWNAVVYTYKEKYLGPLCGNDNFKGIMLPLQLVPKKELRGISHLYISYPDMIEKWTMENGTPSSVVRLEKDRISGGSFSFPKHTAALVPLDELPSWQNNKTLQNVWDISGGHVLPKRRKHYFQYCVKNKNNRTGPVLTITACAVSLVILLSAFSTNRRLSLQEKKMLAYRKSTISRRDENNKKRAAIKKLASEILEMKNKTPLQIYPLLLRIRDTVDKDTIIRSFSLKKYECTLVMTSSSALNNLERIKTGLGTVTVSRITPIPGGRELYTVKVEVR